MTKNNELAIQNRSDQTETCAQKIHRHRNTESKHPEPIVPEHARHQDCTNALTSNSQPSFVLERWARP